jgi:hypothetical protein
MPRHEPIDLSHCFNLSLSKFQMIDVRENILDDDLVEGEIHLAIGEGEFEVVLGFVKDLKGVFGSPLHD